MAGLSVLTPFPTSHASPVIASVGEGGGELAIWSLDSVTPPRAAFEVDVGWGGGGWSGVPHSKPATTIKELGLLGSQSGPLLSFYNRFMVKNKADFLDFWTFWTFRNFWTFRTFGRGGDRRGKLVKFPGSCPTRTTLPELKPLNTSAACVKDYLLL